LGTYGNQWELFATHDCAEIPLAAIVEKFMQPVCLRGEPRKGQFFCRYEYNLKKNQHDYLLINWMIS
jgi:hypothetical protein